MRLQENTEKFKKSKIQLEKVAEKQSKIKSVDKVEVKSPMMDKSKVILDKAEFEGIKTLAQKQIASSSKEKKLIQENGQLKKENQALRQENSNQSKELSKFSQLDASRDKMRLQELEKFQSIVMKF